MVETRSQRRAFHQHPNTSFPQAAYQDESFYPQITSTSPQTAAASVFQSTGHAASYSVGQQSMMLSPATQQQQYTSAPMPSPSSSRVMSGYFSQAQAQQSTTSHPAQHQNRISTNGHHAGAGQRGDNGGMPETAPFLKDFNLVAEAAKRAQMACLTRDLGDVGL